MVLNDDVEDQKEKIPFRPFRSASTEPNVQVKTKKDSVTKRDIFLMSFFSFFFGIILIIGILFLTGAITGNTLFVPGEKAVVIEEDVESPVIDTLVEETTTESIEEEAVVEEAVVEELDPCGLENEVVLNIDETFDYNGRSVILKLAGDFSAQISVGGKKDLISVGEIIEINGLDLAMVDGNEADQTATVYFIC